MQNHRLLTEQMGTSTWMVEIGVTRQAAYGHTLPRLSGGTYERFDLHHSGGTSCGLAAGKIMKARATACPTTSCSASPGHIRQLGPACWFYTSGGLFQHSGGDSGCGAAGGIVAHYGPQTVELRSWADAGVRPCISRVDIGYSGLPEPICTRSVESGCGKEVLPRAGITEPDRRRFISDPTAVEPRTRCRCQGPTSLLLHMMHRLKPRSHTGCNPAYPRKCRARRAS